VSTRRDHHEQGKAKVAHGITHCNAMASATTWLIVERVTVNANEVGEMKRALTVPFVRSGATRSVNLANRLLRFAG
jgi:hypothetical protein